LVNTTSAYIATTLPEEELSASFPPPELAARSGQVDVYASRLLIQVEGASLAESSRSNYRISCSAEARDNCSRLLVIDVANRSVITAGFIFIAGAVTSLALQIMWQIWWERSRAVRRTGSVAP
jgi:hypothetical protein